MKTVRISRLSLTNFKCHSSLSLDLLGKNATLRGDNATGKTSVYDALTWLLFGKDSRGQGEKNIDIKPLNADGAVRDRQAETGVEAVLTVDDTPITLKRTLREMEDKQRAERLRKVRRKGLLQLVVIQAGAGVLTGVLLSLYLLGLDVGVPWYVGALGVSAAMLIQQAAGRLTL